MGLCQTRHKIPLVTLTLRDNITSSWHLQVTPTWVADCQKQQHIVNTRHTGPGQEEIICQKSWAKYGNCESFRTRGGEDKENVDVVGYLWCCREAIYANVMISRNIYGERIEILPRSYIVIPVSDLERRERGGYNIQLARPSNEQCWYSQNQPEQPGESSSTAFFRYFISKRPFTQ